MSSNKDDLSEAMDSLDESQMERVERLILKLASLKKTANTQRRVLPEKVAKQVKRSREKENLDKNNSRAKISRAEPLRPKRRARPAAAEETTAVKPKRKMRKHYATRESIDLDKPRENKFLKMQEASAHKRDTEEFDNKVNKFEPTPRMGRSSLVEIECVGCGNIFDVSPSVIFNDPEEGPIYTCNDCAIPAKRNRNR